jgi:hypothetical protein
VVARVWTFTWWADASGSELQVGHRFRAMAQLRAGMSTKVWNSGWCGPLMFQCRHSI